MRRVSPAVAFGTVFLLLASVAAWPAQARSAGPARAYFSFSGGLGVLPGQENVSIEDGNNRTVAEWTNNGSGAAAVAVGIINKNLRGGIEAGVSSSEVRGLLISGQIREDTDNFYSYQIFASANLVLEFPFVKPFPGDEAALSPFIPYAGAGLGYRWTRLSEDFADALIGEGLTSRANDGSASLTDGFVFDLTAGVRFPLWRDITWQWLGSMDVRYTASVPFDEEDGVSHGLRAGFVMDF